MFDQFKSSLEEKIREQRETIEGLKDDVKFAQNRRELTLDELRSAQDIWASRQANVTSLRLALDSANSVSIGPKLIIHSFVLLLIITRS